MNTIKDTILLLDDIILVAKAQEKFLPPSSAIGAVPAGGDAFVVFHLKQLRENLVELQKETP